MMSHSKMQNDGVSFFSFVFSRCLLLPAGSDKLCLGDLVCDECNATYHFM